MDICQSYRKEDGFTLLELIVTLTILTIIIVLAFGAFRLGIKAWETGDERVEFLYRMKYLVDLMEKEMGSIHPYYTREESEQLKEENQTKVADLIFEGKQDSISFISSSGSRDPSISRGGLREVSFSLNRSEKQLIMTEGIIKSNQPSGTMDNKKTRSIVLSSNVKDLKFRYYKLKRNYNAKYEYDGEWVEDFSAGKENSKSANLPRAIEVTLAIETEKKGIRKAVENFYLPPFIVLLNAGLDFVPTKKEEEKT